MRDHEAVLAAGSYRKPLLSCTQLWQAVPPVLPEQGQSLCGLLLCRYGLIDSDDEDEDGYTEPMQENTAPQHPKDVKGKAAQPAPPKQGYGLFDEDEDMDDDLGSDQTGQCPLLHCSILSSQLAFCHPHL